MINFALQIRSEQPCIKAVLAKMAADLPLSVRPIVDHVLGHGGKALRPLLTIFVSRLLGYRNENIYPLACCLELFHTATLLHDDVLDNADLRRGYPAAHRLFGVTQTILAGDALLAQGCATVASYGEPHLMTVASNAISETTAGEILEIDHQGEIPNNLSSYLKIATGKTAWMIRAACEFGAIKAGAKREQIQSAAEYGLNLGIAFQIVDDVLDFFPTQTTGKPEGGDLREGKCTPPIFYYYESLSPTEQKTFAQSFQSHSLSDAEINTIATIIRTQGFADKARSLADEYLQRAHQALNDLTQDMPSSAEQEILTDFITNVRDREV